jgi:hypothetical protein
MLTGSTNDRRQQASTEHHEVYLLTGQAFRAYPAHNDAPNQND